VAEPRSRRWRRPQLERERIMGVPSRRNGGSLPRVQGQCCLAVETGVVAYWGGGLGRPPRHLAPLDRPRPAPASRQEPRPRRCHGRWITGSRRGIRRVPPAVEPASRRGGIDAGSRIQAASELRQMSASIEQDVRDHVAYLSGSAQHMQMEAVGQAGPLRWNTRFTARARRAPIGFIPHARSRELTASAIRCTWSPWIE